MYRTPAGRRSRKIGFLPILSLNRMTMCCSASCLAPFGLLPQTNGLLSILSPQMPEKLDSKIHALATIAKDGGSVGNAGAIHRPIAILGQAPRFNAMRGKEL